MFLFEDRPKGLCNQKQILNIRDYKIVLSSDL